MDLLHNLTSNLRLFGLNDFLDIAIMAFIIYQFLRLLRSTSSGKVARGILILLLAIGISGLCKLNTVHYILQKIIEYGVLAIVILFQPELRKLLELAGSRFGITVLGKSTPSSEMESAIKETVEAYTSLSESKTGALMVFERNNSLDEQIQTGTSFDAAVNAELLKNIFWNKAPLHDGAVIVREGRIIAAGCMLPMSGNTNLSRDLGMRHRAGIGVSEQTDAVVAIVSEETGTISVAVAGMLKRHLAAETLNQLLRNELITDSSKGENNLVGKISSLFRSTGRGEVNTDEEKGEK